MAVTIERRTTPRTPPGALGAGILIMHETEKWILHARLLDISAGGAFIRPVRGVAKGRQLRILVHEAPELGWIDAEIVRSGGPSEAGVRFLTPFSPEFVLAATTERQPGRDEGAAGKTPYLGDTIPIW